MSIQLTDPLLWRVILCPFGVLILFIPERDTGVLFEPVGSYQTEDKAAAWRGLKRGFGAVSRIGVREKVVQKDVRLLMDMGKGIPQRNRCGVRCDGR